MRARPVTAAGPQPRPAAPSRHRRVAVASAARRRGTVQSCPQAGRAGRQAGRQAGWLAGRPGRQAGRAGCHRATASTSLHHRLRRTHPISGRPSTRKLPGVARPLPRPGAWRVRGGWDMSQGAAGLASRPCAGPDGRHTTRPWPGRAWPGPFRRAPRGTASGMGPVPFTRRPLLPAASRRRAVAPSRPAPADDTVRPAKPTEYGLRRPRRLCLPRDVWHARLGGRRLR